MSVSGLRVLEFDGDETLKNSSLSNKLEYFASRPGAMARIERDAPLKFPATSSLSSGNIQNRIAALYALEEKLAKDEHVLTLPGVRLLWTPENMERLMDKAKEGLEKLPKEPFDWSVIIKLRANAYGLRGDRVNHFTWRDLARRATDMRGANVTEKAVRHAFVAGTAQVRAHILKHLTPDLGAIVAETPTATRRRRRAS
jgi:hypothetical protein